MGFMNLTAVYLPSQQSWRTRKREKEREGLCLLWYQQGLCVFSRALLNREATPDSQIAEQRVTFNKSVWHVTSHLLLPSLVWLLCSVISCPHRCTSCLVSHPCHFHTHSSTSTSVISEITPLYRSYCHRHHCNDTTALNGLLCVLKTDREKKS